MHSDAAVVTTVSDYVARRDRVVALGVAVLMACSIVATGSSPAAVLPALLVGVLALVAVALLAMACREHEPEPRPASAVHLRVLDRLAMAPVIAIALTAVVAAARW